jgi:hypothetical protein
MSVNNNRTAAWLRRSGRACLQPRSLLDVPVQTWFFKEAFYGDAQLRHRMSWTLSQMWVISGIDTQQSSHMLEYHQQLSKNAFGTSVS